MLVFSWTLGEVATVLPEIVRLKEIEIMTLCSRQKGCFGFALKHLVRCASSIIHIYGVLCMSHSLALMLNNCRNITPTHSSALIAKSSAVQIKKKNLKVL